MTTNRSRVGVFLTLDGLRGVAAIAVAMRHSPTLFGWLASLNNSLAVDLFFVLSGFVLAHAYGKRLRGEMTILAFMKVRLIRLYPLYFLGFILGSSTIAAALLLGRGELGQHEILNITGQGVIWAAAFGLLMLPSPQSVSPELYPLNGPSWSLLCELIANLVWVVGVRLCSRPLRTISFAVVGLSATTLFMLNLAGVDLNAGATWQFAFVGFVRIAFSFTVGTLIYQAPAFPIKFNPLTLLFALAVLLFVKVPDAWLGNYELVCILFAFPLLVAAAATSEPGALLARPLRFLGLTSYALYMIHKPLEDVAIGSAIKFAHLNLYSIAPAGGLVILTAILAVAWLADTLYDGPVRAWLAGRGRVRPRIAPAPSGQ